MSVNAVLRSPRAVAIAKSPKFRSAVKTSLEALKGTSMAYGYALGFQKFGMTIPEVMLYKDCCKAFSKGLPMYIRSIKNMFKCLCGKVVG